MSRCFSCITVHTIENGMALLSQNHYDLRTDDANEEYRLNNERRELEIPVRGDETRKSLFTRLNKDETFIIGMYGNLEKAKRNPSYINEALIDID